MSTSSVLLRVCSVCSMSYVDAVHSLLGSRIFAVNLQRINLNPAFEWMNVESASHFVTTHV